MFIKIGQLSYVGQTNKTNHEKILENHTRDSEKNLNLPYHQLKENQQPNFDSKEILAKAIKFGRRSRNEGLHSKDYMNLKQVLGLYILHKFFVHYSR